MSGTPEMPESTRRSRRQRLTSQVGGLVRAIGDGDDKMVENAVLTLSRSKRIFAPLAFIVGAFVMLFDGLKLLVSNWRFTLIQVLPAMWIWFAMFDLKAHVIRGHTFRVIEGPKLIPIALLIVAITAVSFYLNAVFAFGIASGREPAIRPAFRRANDHLRVILAWGVLIGIALAMAAVVVDRWGLRWFALSMSIVVGLMMYCYVAIPARLIGINTSRSSYSRRDKLAASAVGGAIGAVVCTPPYAIARVGILMLGVKTLFIPGLFVLTLGIALQAGATGSIKAIKMSSKLIAGKPLEPVDAIEPAPPLGPEEPPGPIDHPAAS
jgi:hypothetical protein